MGTTKNKELANTAYLASVNHSDDHMKLKALMGETCILVDSGNCTLVEVVSFTQKNKLVAGVLKVLDAKAFNSRKGVFAKGADKPGKMIKISANMDFGTCSVVLQVDDENVDKYLVFTTGYGTSRMLFIPELIDQFLEEDTMWYETFWETYEF